MYIEDYYAVSLQIHLASISWTTTFFSLVHIQMEENGGLHCTSTLNFC
jgi:hypothetical protein